MSQISVHALPNEYQAPAAAHWAESLGFRSVYILDNGEAYGKGLADLFEETVYELGLEVLGHVTIDKMAGDYRKVLEEVAATNPDLVYVGGYTPGEMQGIDGHFTFDINGDTTITTVSGSVIRDGTFEYLETLAP